MRSRVSFIWVFKERRRNFCGRDRGGGRKVLFVLVRASQREK